MVGGPAHGHVGEEPQHQPLDDMQRMVVAFTVRVVLHSRRVVLHSSRVPCH